MIEVQGLTKRYRGVLAVDDLSFTVRPGVVTGFLGPNGAGKSTTMRMVLGLDRPTAGSATVRGRSYARAAAPLREVGALLDPKDVHGGRTAFAHLLALAQSNGLPASRVTEVLETTGLSGVARRRVGGFSLGMSQRLGIAGALLGDPAVLLFDEPVNGLDPEGVLWIRSLLRSLAREGRTVLVSSHLMSEMALTADHLVVIGRGRLLADTSTRDFVDGGSVGRVRVRTPQADALAAVLRERGHAPRAVDGYLELADATTEQVGDAAASRGLVVHELFVRRSSLEDAFLELTGDSVDHPSRPLATAQAGR